MSGFKIAIGLGRQEVEPFYNTIYFLEVVKILGAIRGNSTRHHLTNLLWYLIHRTMNNDDPEEDIKIS